MSQAWQWPGLARPLPGQIAQLSLMLACSLKQGPQTSLVVQWLRLCTPNAGGTGLIPGQGTKVPHAAWCSQKYKERKVK